MKKVFIVLLIMFNLIWISGCGCSKIDFTYFSEHVNSIENYKYYVITQEIHNNDLLLYKQDKSVYFDEDKVRIVIDTKSINEIDADDVYSENREELYKQGNKVYYKENGVWKVKTRENSEEIGFSFNEDMFSDYEIDKGDKRTFVGTLKETSVSEFLGFELAKVSDMKLNIVINKNDKVESVSLEYIEENGNKVNVSIVIGYEYVSKFEIPTVE